MEPESLDRFPNSAGGKHAIRLQFRQSDYFIDQTWFQSDNLDTGNCGDLSFMHAHGEEKSTSRAMIVFRNQRIGVEKARTRVKVADVINGSFELVAIDRVTGVNWDKVTNLLRWKGLYTA